MAEIILGLFVGLLLGYAVRHLTLLQRTATKKKPLVVPAPEATTEEVKFSWTAARAGLVRFLKFWAQEPVFVGVGLLVAWLGISYAVHISHIQSMADYRHYEETYVRFSLAVVVGILGYWIAILTTHREFRLKDIPPGMQATIRNLIIGAVVLVGLLAAYVKPPQLLGRMFESLQHAEIMGMKVLFQPRGEDSAFRSALWRASPSGVSRLWGLAPSDLSKEQFARPFPNLRLVLSLFQSVALRNDQDYYDVFGIAKPWMERARTGRRAVQKVFVPVSACLYYLKSRSLLAPSVDARIANLNQLMRELLQFNLYYRENAEAARPGLRSSQHKLEDTLKQKILSASEGLLDELNGSWSAVQDEFGAIYSANVGEWERDRESAIIAYPADESEYWMACNVASLRDKSVALDAIAAAIESIDLRLELIMVLTSFFSLYIEDLPHAVQRYDTWIQAVLRPELDEALGPLSEGGFRERIRRYCADVPGSSEAGETALLLCLSYGRANFYQDKIVDLYKDKTVLNIAVQIDLSRNMYEVYSALYDAMMRAEVSRKSELCKKIWTCRMAAKKTLAMLFLQGNNMAYLLSGLAAEVPAADAALVDSYCREIWSGGWDGVLAGVAQIDRMDIGHMQSVVVDSCGRWELRRSEEILTRRAEARASRSARLEAAAIREKVDLLNDICSRTDRAVEYWKAESDKKTLIDGIGHRDAGDEKASKSDGVYKQMKLNEPRPEIVLYQFGQLKFQLTRMREALLVELRDFHAPQEEPTR